LSATGSALVIVRAPHRCTVAVARLSRVTVTGDVDMASAAIALCLAHGLPVIFEDVSRHAMGAALPNRPATARLADLLAEWSDRPAWPAVYANWLRACRWHILRAWRHDCEDAGRPVPEPVWTEAVRRNVYRGEPGGTEPLHSWCLGMTLTSLLEWDLPCNLRTADAAVTPLANDLSSLLVLSIHLESGLLFASLPDTNPLAWRALESRQLAYQRRLGAWLGHLRKLLLDDVVPCR
jgi:hypothetical protein